MNFDRLRELLLDQAMQGSLLSKQSYNKTTCNNQVQPKDWKVFDFSKVATLLNGRAYKRDELLTEVHGNTPILRVGNFFTSDKWYYSDLTLEDNKYCENGDLLYAWSASFGPKLWDGPRCIYHYHIWKIEINRENVDKKWLYYWLLAKTKALKSSGHGMAMIHITKKGMEAEKIVVPPLDEQTRIVAKLEEAFNEIDRAEKAYEELQTLAGVLRGQILQKAIQGQLVTQLDTEPSVEMIGVAPRDVPFEIPDSWKWIRLDVMATIVRGGSPRPIKSFITEREDGLNWIKIGDAERGTARISHCAEKIVPEGLKKTRFIKRGSLLLTNSMSFGYPYILDVDGCIHDGWLAFSDFESVLNRDYLYYTLLSPYCRSVFVSKAAGAVVKNLNIDKVKEVFIPVPPVKEQARIVAKVEELLKQVDALSAG